jgi:hypothetical protein
MAPLFFRSMYTHFPFWETMKCRAICRNLERHEASMASLVWLSSLSVCQQLCQRDMNSVEDVLLQYSDWKGQPL